jgi:predicted ATPase
MAGSFVNHIEPVTVSSLTSRHGQRREMIQLSNCARLVGNRRKEAISACFKKGERLDKNLLVHGRPNKFANHGIA